MRRELTANNAQALLARIRPADDVAAVRLHIARDHLADIRALDARLNYIAGQAQADRGQNSQGGAALPQAAAIRSGLAAACPRPARHNRNVRITHDPAADAASIHLTGQRLTRGRTTIPATPPEGVLAFVVLDWKDDRLVGIEILDASSRLRPDLLDEAETLS